MRNLNVAKAVLVSFVIMAGSVSGAFAALTAEQILEESQKAMGVPAHYRIVSQGMEISVYQKPLPDGSIAMLTDMSTPIKRTTTVYGEKSYDLYLDKKTAVDTSGLLAEVKGQPGIAQLLSAAKGVKVAVKLTRTFTYNGKECYEVEQAMPIPAALLVNLPEAMAKSIPSKNRFVIDTETFLIHEHETFSADGSSIAKLQYLDFEPMLDLTDDIFQVPGGLKFWHQNQYLSTPRLPGL